MTTSTELERCPFCGCPAYHRGGGSSRSGPVPYAVACVNILCGVQVQSTAGRAEAAAKWNLREKTRP